MPIDRGLCLIIVSVVSSWLAGRVRPLFRVGWPKKASESFSTRWLRCCKADSANQPLAVAFGRISGLSKLVGKFKECRRLANKKPVGSEAGDRGHGAGKFIR